MKDNLLWYQPECDQKCTSSHGTRRHSQIKVVRFKTKLQQFLSIDDQHWQDAINLQFKMDELISKLKTIKQQISLAITDKKLLYALNWDESDRIINIFKLAINGQYNRLTCNDLFRVHSKIQKPRNVLIKQIKKISQDISDNMQKQVEMAVKYCFNSGGRYEKKEEPVKEEKVITRSERVRENNKNPFNNNFPTVKINQIDEIQTHFNVIIKVIKINKHFRIEGMAKIEFQGGDETGKSLVVIDQIQSLKVGKVFAISNARIYSFHGVKQIQMSRKDSEITELNTTIENIGDDYHLSRRRNRGGEQRQRRPPKRQQRQQNTRGGNENQSNEIEERRPNREDRPPREYWPRRDDRTDGRPRETRIPKQSNKAKIEEAREDKPQRQRQGRQYPKNENRQQQVERDNKPRGQRALKRDRISDQSQNESASAKIPQNNYKRQKEYQIVKDRTLIDRRPKYQVQSRPQKDEYSRYGNKPQKSKQQKISKRSSSQSSSSSSSLETEQKKSLKIQPGLQKIHSNKQLNKIGSIQPGDQGLNIIAEIYKKQIDGPQPDRGHFLSIIGDQTGIIRINLPKNNPAVKQGAVISIILANAEVDLDHRITLKLSDDGLIQKTSMKMTRININKNISEELWESDEQDKDQQDSKPIIEDF